MRTIGIIQARNGADRLPNKSSMELLGKPMLQHVIERVKRAKRLDDVVVATPTGAENWPLAKLAKDCGAQEFFSSFIDENDLVKRYFHCARKFKADLIVRICADNPCIEPEAIDLLIEHGNLMGNGALVLATNAGDFRMAEKSFGWPDGIGAELYNMKMLEFLNFEISKPELREHPHKFYHDTHNVIVPPCPKDWWQPGLRLDVNTLEDFEFIEKIYQHFGNNEFHIGDIIKQFCSAER